MNPPALCTDLVARQPIWCTEQEAAEIEAPKALEALEAPEAQLEAPRRYFWPASLRFLSWALT